MRKEKEKQEPRFDLSIGFCPFVRGACRTKCVFHEERSFCGGNTGHYNACLIRESLRRLELRAKF